MRGISRLGEKLSAFQEGLCSMKLVSQAVVLSQSVYLVIHSLSLAVSQSVWQSVSQLVWQSVSQSVSQSRTDMLIFRVTSQRFR
jgi:hypothetical protein